MFGVGRSAFTPSPYELDREVCACRLPAAWLSSGACSPVWRLFASAATMIDRKMPSLKAVFYRLLLVRPYDALVSVFRRLLGALPGVGSGWLDTLVRPGGCK